MSLSGKLLGCGSASFTAQRKDADTLLQAQAASEPPAPAPGGPLDGVWRGSLSCLIRRGQPPAFFPATLNVSQQGSAFAAFLSATVPDRRDGGTLPGRAVYLDQTGNGRSLDTVVVLDRDARAFLPRSITIGPDGRTLEVEMLVQQCTASFAKTAASFSAVAAASAGLVGDWASPAHGLLGGQPSPWADTSSQMRFRRSGDVLYGQFRVAFPPDKPAAEQDRLVVDLRPILATEDGQVGFVSTVRREANGVFTPGTVGSMFASPLLLLRPPTAQDTRLELAVATRSGSLAGTNMVLERHSAEEETAIAVSEAREPLPAGIGGRLATGASLRQQCEVLANWGRPLISRPDAMTTSLDRLQREALPLFQDEAFRPVFGLSYLLTTPEQRRPVYFLLMRDCPQRAGMQQLGYYDLAMPWSPQPEGGFSYGAVTAKLVDLRSTQNRIAATMAKLAALPQTPDGPTTLERIAQEGRPDVEQLDDARRQAFVHALTDARVRVDAGILNERVASAGNLLAEPANPAMLQRFPDDLEHSDLSETAKAAAFTTVRGAAQAIAAKLIAAQVADAAQAPVNWPD